MAPGRALPSRRATVPAPDDARVCASLDVDGVLGTYGSSWEGLAPAEARARLARDGPNSIADAPRAGALRALLAQFLRPLPLLLLALAGVDAATGQRMSAAVIMAIVGLSSLLGFIQEHRSDRAVRRLRAMVRTHVDVVRPAAGPAAAAVVACPPEALVTGDVVLLAAGDPVPADVRFLEAIDLFIDESALSGESMAVAKGADGGPDAIGHMGTHVISGSARALVIATGAATRFGQVAAALAEARARTDFDRGIDRVAGLLLRFMLALAPLVLLLNWASKGDPYQALLFATAVAVGLAPELLPMIVTINLARGALALARRQVIVKRLGAVQTLGAIDILCTDKTGTLTQDRVVLEQHVDIAGKASDMVLDHAYLNSYFQTGLNNLLDKAILRYAHVHLRVRPEQAYRKAGEIPFDFRRRRMSVVLDRPDGTRLLICKGAVEEVTAVCASAERDGARTAFGTAHADTLGTLAQGLNADGLRVIAIAYRVLARDEDPRAGAVLERDLVLLGYIAFLDPPKESAAPALAALARHGVEVKVLSGDNAAVCAHVCRLVGIGADAILDGPAVDRLDDAALAGAVRATRVFARLAPEQKTRVIRCLQRQGRVVGFLGDGINDGPALKRADVGIAVDSGADIARESADLVLMRKSLVSVADGVLVGRTVFGNIVKYIRMSASSNCGNMFSVLGASILLPFLPMAPVQILLNNLLYDCSQTALTTDRVDPVYLAAPRHWDVASIRRYVMCFGPISSVFDYATFGLLWFVLGAAADPALFQTGWFVESLLSQTLVVQVLRTGARPGAANRPSAALLAASAAVCCAALWLPASPFGATFGFVPLPAGYWWGLCLILAAYAGAAQLAKSWLVRRFGLA